MLGLGAAVSIGVLWLLRNRPLPYVWAALAFAGWNAACWRAFARESTRVVAFNLMGVALAFALAERAAAWMEPATRGAASDPSIEEPLRDAGSEPDPAALGFPPPVDWRYDYTTGYGLEVFLAGGRSNKDPAHQEFGAISRPNVRWFERGVMNGKVAYEQVYQTGAYRERIRPTDDPAAADTGPLVLALGDSFVFGWGLPWQGTMPARLERRLPDGYRVLNLAHSGWSAAYVALWLSPQSAVRPAFAPGRVRFAVLDGISDHLGRVAGVGAWRTWPVYDVRDGMLVKAESLSADTSFFSGPGYRSSRILFRSHLVRRMLVGFSGWRRNSVEQAAIDRYVRLVLYCARRVKELYGVPLLVVHWDSFFGYGDVVASRLEAGGVAVLTEREVFPGGFGPQYTIGIDPHPNARAADLVAAAVARWFETHHGGGSVRR